MRITVIFAFVAIILLMIISFRSGNKFQFIRAGFLFIIGIFLSTLNFIGLFLLSDSIISDFESINLGSLFLLLGIFVVISGLLIYILMRILERFVNFSSTSLSILEYYIQWSLIYITIYQVLFSNAKSIESFTRFIRAGRFLNPNILIAIVLPSFISIWIATILFKKHIKAL